MRNLKRIGLASLLLAIAAAPVWAGNGHMLHGFGPVNSSMGGAGVALATDPVGALMTNPALLATMSGDHILFSTEFFEDGIEIQVNLTGGNPPGKTGATNASNQLGVLPAFGWTTRDEGSPWGFGFGLVAIAGFRTDYPEDPNSILFDPPPYGFGRIWTDYRVTRIPFAAAKRVNDKLAVGASLNVYLGELAIAPLPYVVYDLNDPNDDNTRFYPQGDGLVNEFSFGLQLGFLYTVSPALDIGGSITTDQDFDPFTWNSTIAAPLLFDTNFQPGGNAAAGSFGRNRPLDYDLDGPLHATVGAGWRPNPQDSFAFDVTWIEYKGVSGFGSPGGVVNRTVQPFGWRDVWAFKLGYQRVINPTWTVRAGYNYANTPIKNRNVLSATGALATFEHHFCAGVSFQLTSKVSAEASFYHVPRTHIVGPYPDLDNNVLGTMDSSNKLDSILVGLSWDF